MAQAGVKSRKRLFIKIGLWVGVGFLFMVMIGFEVFRQNAQDIHKMWGKYHSGSAIQSVLDQVPTEKELTARGLQTNPVAQQRELTDALKEVSQDNLAELNRAKRQPDNAIAAHLARNVFHF